VVSLNLAHPVHTDH